MKKTHKKHGLVCTWKLLSENDSNNKKKKDYSYDNMAELLRKKTRDISLLWNVNL